MTFADLAKELFCVLLLLLTLAAIPAVPVLAFMIRDGVLRLAYCYPV